MVISTKGRYALRLMIDLAQHCDEGYISLKTVAQRQNVSLKYMEAIAAALNRASLVLSQRGKDSAGDIALPALRNTLLTERAEQCLTLPMWKKLDAVMDNYLSSVSVQDLLDGKV